MQNIEYTYGVSTREWIICKPELFRKLQNYQPLGRPGAAQRCCPGAKLRLMRQSHPRASIPLPTAKTAFPDPERSGRLGSQ